LEQPGVFDGDHRLVGEGFQKFDLAFVKGELPDGGSEWRDRQRFPKQRNRSVVRCPINSVGFATGTAIDHGKGQNGTFAVDHRATSGRLTVMGECSSATEGHHMQRHGNIVPPGENLGIFASHDGAHSPVSTACKSPGALAIIRKISLVAAAAPRLANLRSRAIVALLRNRSCRSGALVHLWFVRGFFGGSFHKAASPAGRFLTC
jgi:hypothetical protein